MLITNLMLPCIFVVIILLVLKKLIFFLIRCLLYIDSEIVEYENGRTVSTQTYCMVGGDRINCCSRLYTYCIYYIHIYNRVYNIHIR